MPDADAVEGARRTLKTREKPWAQSMARWVGSKNISPNAISVISVIFALGGAALMFFASDAWCSISAAGMWLGAAACIQLRLLCNMLDGMVAIEGGKKSPVGGLYNEVPDRIADALFLIGAGYCNEWVIKLWGLPLGWIATALALLAPYIRVLGGTLTGTQSFIGPMAKQHRMFLLTLACFGSAAEVYFRTDGKPAEVVMTAALAIMCVGTAWTCWRRLRLISQDLYKKASPEA